MTVLTSHFSLSEQEEEKKKPDLPEQDVQMFPLEICSAVESRDNN